MKHLIITLFLVAVCSHGMSAQVDSTFYVQGSVGRLSARLQMPETANGKKCPIVILCHGFMGNKDSRLFDEISKDLVGKGIGVVRFDFNGHGKSDGEFRYMTVPNEIADTKAIIDWTKRQPFTKNISLLGHSQGGVVASMTAGELGKKEIKSLVLMAPAAVLRDDALRGNTMGAKYDPWNAPEYVTMPNGLKLGHDYIVTARELPIYETASRYTGPVFIIHGKADNIVPYTYGERFGHDLKNASIRLMPGEDHSFTHYTAEAAEIAADWLEKELK